MQHHLQQIAYSAILLDTQEDTSVWLHMDCGGPGWSDGSMDQSAAIKRDKGIAVDSILPMFGSSAPARSSKQAQDISHRLHHHIRNNDREPHRLLCLATAPSWNLGPASSHCPATVPAFSRKKTPQPC
ncbi:hypothetical protein BD289DRAFT_103466 [Coniella lustricola]|uniref:Uncharacterized protein n=1 Tax=Coniella lustricola TaxID=2025994 RepID=A0A2T2ZXX2_9PEZI|nr:hypothetical protein BD289DRAFT_103466 [Coniella lustricola]